MPNAANTDGAAQIAATTLPAAANSVQTLRTVASAFRLSTPGMPPGRDGGIKSGIIQLFGQSIRHNADAAGRFDDLFAAHGSNRYFHTGTAQQIHAQKALALFQAGRKKDNSFAHTKHSFTK